MIIVTGATGKLGRSVVHQLVRRVPAENTGVSVRDPGKARDLAAAGVRVRRGDFADPESLADAFAGVTQLFMVSSNAAAYGGDPLAQHRNAIDAARAAGARRIVYTSQLAASPTSLFPPAVDHAVTEEMLRTSGLRWTALRHGFHAASAMMSLGGGIQDGVVAMPADGPIAWTAHDDLAEADAAVLADEGRFEGPTPPLTASDAHDLAGLAAVLADVLGRPVDRRVITDEELAERLAARGVPQSAVAIAQGHYAAARNGEFDRADPTLEQLIGRRPTTMREFLAEQLAASGSAGVTTSVPA